MKEFIQSLNKEQFEAITSPDSILLTAIPGSGKTRSLINKVIFEYDENDNRFIVAITYTRRAANEIEDRIQEQLGFMPSNIWIGTIHKFCLEFIVRGYGSYSNYFSKNFQIISEPDQKKIKQELRKKYNISDPYLSIDFTLDIKGNPNEKKYINLVNDYYQALFSMSKIDFNYILYESYRLLNIHPHIRKQISTLISYLCIDEYQDTQELQYQILGILSDSNDQIRVFITGDSNQAIYEGIGGVTKNANELELIFNRKFNEKHLSGCYRSNQAIIDFYQNFAISKMEMVSKTDKWLSPVVKIESDNTKNEVFNKIYKIIEESIKLGYKESDIAIVAPQWHQVYEISTEIKKRFPDLKLDAPDIVPLKKDEEGIIYKISKLLLTSFDYYNLNRIKQIAIEIIKQFKDEYGIEIDGTTLDFLNLVKSSQSSDSVGTEYLSNSLTELFYNLKLLDVFKIEIDSFVQGTKERIEEFKEQGLEDEKIYFEQSLRSKTGVVISSCHGVKGEEYAIVIAFALLEGYIPHWNDIINHKEVARQRSNKLLFVVCSRAKEQLYLFAENNRKNNKGNLYKTNEDLRRIQCLLK